MIFSDTVRYALLALSYLALNNGRLVKAEEIAKVHRIPRPFLAKVMHELTKRGFLHSVKGPKGGFALAKDPKEISIWDVIEAFGDAYKYEMCILMPVKCSDYNTNPCVVHPKWEEVKARVVDFFKKTTIDELAGVEEKHFAHKA
ncbi:MAG: Rrf2 family transcriptional regulator [Aquificae bacterium]|nr:Rrf2 family transcriptional regulator [Aquificota bacterium]